MSAIKALAVSAFALLLKHMVTITIQGGKKFAAGARPPEDVSLGLNNTMGNGAAQIWSNEAASEEARMADIRWKQIVLNDVENIPLGLIIFIISNLCGADQILNATCIAVFTAGRICHTISYAYGLQPWRSLFFFAALIPVIISSIAAMVTIL